ncbi:hypothetical protein Droror1_Dr00012790 [Drosera rotundifolia]
MLIVKFKNTKSTAPAASNPNFLSSIVVFSIHNTQLALFLEIERQTRNTKHILSPHNFHELWSRVGLYLLELRIPNCPSSLLISILLIPPSCLSSNSSDS